MTDAATPHYTPPLMPKGFGEYLNTLVTYRGGRITALEQIRGKKEDEIVISDGKRKLAQIFKIPDGFAVQIPNKYIKDRGSTEWSLRTHDRKITDGDISSPNAEPKMSFHIEKELFVQVSGRGVLSGRERNGKVKGAGFYKKELTLEYYDTQHIGHIGIIVNSNLDNYELVEQKKLNKKVLNMCASEKIITLIFLANRKLTDRVFCEYVRQVIEEYEKVMPDECHATGIPLKIGKYDTLVAVSLPCNEMAKAPIFGCMSSARTDGSQLILGIKRVQKTPR